MQGKAVKNNKLLTALHKVWPDIIYPKIWWICEIPWAEPSLREVRCHGTDVKSNIFHSVFVICDSAAAKSTITVHRA